MVFADMISRQLCETSSTRIPPRVNIYISGFPCVDSSALGRRKGLDGTTMSAMWSTLHYIVRYRPTTFVCENMVYGAGRLPPAIKEFMRQLRRRARCYDVQEFVLDALDYGLHTSRKRVFIVGVLQPLLKLPFCDWLGILNSLKFKATKRIQQSLLDNTCSLLRNACSFGLSSLTELEKAHLAKLRSSIGASMGKSMIDLSVRWAFSYAVGATPTITTSSKLWCPWLSRSLAPLEHFALLG